MRITRVLAVCLAVAAIAVPVAMAFGFNDSSHPPDGIVGTPYSYEFLGRNGCPPFTFSVKSGSLPPGLSLSSSGPVTGTPTTEGSYFFWMQLDDICGSVAAQRPFTINIVAKLTVTTGSPLAPAAVGVPYAVKLTADGGGSQTWSLASGSLPTGLALAADGTISGTPTEATSAPVSFVVKVTDDARSDTKTLVLDVVTPLAVTAATLPTTEVGHALKPATVAATGGRAPYAWSLVGAPVWLTIDPASGAINGTPTAAGSFPLQVSAKDAYGTTATLNLSVVVNAKVAGKTTRLPVTKVGHLFRATLRTTGGVGPFSWKVTSGKFPVGIRLDRKTGVLSGMARKAGTFPLTFAVTDALGETSEVELTLTVNPVAKKKKK